MSGLAIDGSYGEGGGQLTRCAVALAAITGRPLRLSDIRARRARPGLMAQHLTALRAVAALSGGALEGARLGASEIRFVPGRIRGGDYAFDVGTAGSVALVLQALLPVALHADGPCRLAVTGGTDVRMAPPLDYLREVFLPWLARMGVEARIESARRGYYPRGGGNLVLALRPCERLRPLLAESPGVLQAIRGEAHAARLPLHIPERMAAAARACLAGLGPLQLRSRLLDEAEACGTGAALTLVAQAEHALLGAATVAERGVPAERLGTEAGLALRAEIESGAAVDVHALDQLLVYAAQAEGRSVLCARELSLHAQTLLWLLGQFLPVRFDCAMRGRLHRVEVIPGRR